ncbi:MAG: cytochrome c oxidase subunit II [Bacteroidota bacterium]
MTQIAIWGGALLLLIILLTLFRISRLVAVVSEADKKRETNANKINAALMVGFMVVGFGITFWYSYNYFGDYTLPVASEHGIETDRLFWITMAVTGFVFVVTSILLFVFPYMYQFRENRKALFYPHNNRLELIWTVIPAIVLTLLIGSGLKTWTDITDAPSQDAVEFELMGYQFAWRARYGGADGVLGPYNYQLIDKVNEFGLDLTQQASLDDFMPPEVHVPKGQEVNIKIRARDVLHSVFIPHMRVKMDAVPGMPTNFKFTPTLTTEEMRAELGDPEFNYEIACTEVCGRGHFSMRLILVIDEPEEYEEWYAAQTEKTFLDLNPSYMEKVPENLREVALISTGVEPEEVSDVVELESTLN